MTAIEHTQKTHNTQERLDTTFLKFIAILLITNSHLDTLYPFPILASGGSLGNSLFFMLSGLGLALSRDHKDLPVFHKWYWLRSLRIYPAIWLVILFFGILLSDKWLGWTFMNYVYEFVYPTSFWFISALMLFYILLYPILRFRLDRWALPLVGVLLLPYFYLYFNHLDLSVFSIENAGIFKWIFYFQIVLFGLWLAPQYKLKLEPKPSDFLKLALAFIAYAALKILIAKGLFTQMQFLIHWVTFPFVYYALKVSKASSITQLFAKKVFGSLIAFLGLCTLEIYLLQHDIYNLAFIQALAFPMNVMVFWLLLLCLTWPLNKLSLWMQYQLKRVT